MRFTWLCIEEGHRSAMGVTFENWSKKSSAFFFLGELQVVGTFSYFFITPCMNRIILFCAIESDVCTLLTDCTTHAISRWINRRMYLFSTVLIASFLYGDKIQQSVFVHIYTYIFMCKNSVLKICYVPWKISES